MASIFRRDDNYVDQPKRNTVDFSFQNNMTTDFGSLRPCFCTPVMPGDSLRIKPTFGLRFLPMQWPVQTRMKASIHYFYVRNRNLWKDWPDFIGKTKEGLVPPYIHLTQQNRKQIETCQLGDFLGLPTKVYDKVFQGRTNNFRSSRLDFSSSTSTYFYGNEGTLVCVSDTVGNTIAVGDNYGDLFTYTTETFTSMRVCLSSLLIDGVYHAQESKLRLSLSFPDLTGYGTSFKLTIFDKTGKCVYVSDVITTPGIADLPYEVSIGDIKLSEDWFEGLNSIATVLVPTDSNRMTSYNPPPIYKVGKEIISSIDVAEQPLSMLPWRSDENSEGIPLSALPFRAYEAIYNVFYRNAENNPLLINGVPEYNKWNRTLDGGADTNFYPIEYHNWEDDFLTTAVPSPQQGNAPLVGLSGTPTVTIGHEDGTTTEMSLEVAEDGSVTAAHAVSGDEATQAALVEAVQYGISINDFRNVNSFQRWLENNIRRGYKYKDQIKTHYGVSVRYDELDMPEFIGGTSQPVMVNQISQTVPTADSPLGDIAGQASSVGQGSEITHYCDEHGFIIGILCVKPVANYSQLLPKYFNVTDTFDYYFPEFGHIGMQPITYSEVTPLQANLEGKLNDVFGYQRAWYDLIAKTDEVHGLFRSDFRNFLINRTFDGTPELGKEFTVIDPNQVNDVFAYTENTDKILGQIYMEISKKTPIPLYGIPKLE